MATELKHTVKPSGGDFSGLAEAITHIATTHADLVTADLFATIEIDGAWSSMDAIADTITLADTIITSATCYLNIYTTAAARHAGKWNTGAYILEVTDDIGFVVNVNYVRFDGFQIISVSPTAGGNKSFYITGQADGANDIRISNSILRGHANDTYYNRALDIGGSADVSVWNCVMYGFGVNGDSYVVEMNAPTGTLKIYSSTIIGGSYGIDGYQGDVTAKNCYVGGATAYDYGGTITKTTCASSDATGTAGLQGILVSETADATHAGFVNIGAGTEDFHLKAGSPLAGVGTDTSGDAAPMNFTTDIDGDSRT